MPVLSPLFFQRLDLQPPFPDILTVVVVRGKRDMGVGEGFGSTLAGPSPFVFCPVLPSLWTRVLHRGWKQERCREGREFSASCDPFVSWCNQL